MAVNQGGHSVSGRHAGYNPGHERALALRVIAGFEAPNETTCFSRMFGRVESYGLCGHFTAGGGVG